MDAIRKVAALHLLYISLFFLAACGDSYLLSEEDLSTSSAVSAEKAQSQDGDLKKQGEPQVDSDDQETLPPEEQTALPPVDIAGAWLIKCKSISTDQLLIGCHLVSEQGQRHPQGDTADWAVVSEQEETVAQVTVIGNPSSYQQDFVFRPQATNGRIKITASLPGEVSIESSTIDLANLVQSPASSGPLSEPVETVETVGETPSITQPSESVMPEASPEINPACEEFDSLPPWRQDLLGVEPGTKIAVAESRTIYNCYQDNGGMNFCGHTPYEPEVGNSWQNAWEVVATCPESP